MKTIKVINQEFHKTLMKLSNQEMPIKTAKKVLELLRQVQEETTKYDNARIKFMSEKAEKKENGDAKVDEDGRFVFPEEAKAEVNTKIREMLEKDIKFKKIKASELEEARLSAQEFSLLEDIIS